MGVHFPNTLQRSQNAFLFSLLNCAYSRQSNPMKDEKPTQKEVFFKTKLKKSFRNAFYPVLFVIVSNSWQ